MRWVIGTALALVVLPAGPGCGPGEEKIPQKPSYLRALEMNPFYLRADPSLKAYFNVEPDHPKLSQIIAKLSEATGLEMTVDGTLKNHEPDFGYIQPSKPGFYAWQIMEMVAQKGLQYGYWEKIEQGYRLTGISVAPVPIAHDSNTATLFWWLAGFPVLFLVFLAAFKFRSWRQQKIAPSDQARS